MGAVFLVFWFLTVLFACGFVGAVIGFFLVLCGYPVLGALVFWACFMAGGVLAHRLSVY